MPEAITVSPATISEVQPMNSWQFQRRVGGQCFTHLKTPHKSVYAP
jgi:hypothetical protein